MKSTTYRVDYNGEQTYSYPTYEDAESAIERFLERDVRWLGRSNRDGYKIMEVTSKGTWLAVR